jgi:xanthine dehydrogenase accessory factor
MIGSRRKVALVRQSFIESGVATPEEFDAVQAPIGLDIGAETVPEIATSILAQIITVRRKGSVGRGARDMGDR